MNGKPFGEATPPGPIQIDVSQCPTIVCSNCGCPVFINAMTARRVSPIQSPTHKLEVVTIPVLACAHCHSLINMLDPLTLNEFNKRKEKAS